MYVYVCISYMVCIYVYMSTNAKEIHEPYVSHWWGWSYDMQLAKDQDHTSNRGRIHYRVDDHLSSGVSNMFHTETVPAWQRMSFRKNQWDKHIRLIFTHNLTISTFFNFLIFSIIAISSINHISIYFFFTQLDGRLNVFVGGFLQPYPRGKWRARHWTFTKFVWMNWFFTDMIWYIWIVFA